MLSGCHRFWWPAIPVMLVVAGCAETRGIRHWECSPLPEYPAHSLNPDLSPEQITNLRQQIVVPPSGVPTIPATVLVAPVTGAYKSRWGERTEGGTSTYHPDFESMRYDADHKLTRALASYLASCGIFQVVSADLPHENADLVLEATFDDCSLTTTIEKLPGQDQIDVNTATIKARFRLRSRQGAVWEFPIACTRDWKWDPGAMVWSDFLFRFVSEIGRIDQQIREATARR